MIIIGGLLFMILAAIFAALFGDHLLAMLRDKQESPAMNDVDHAALDEELAEIVTGIEQERINAIIANKAWYEDPTERMTQTEWNSFTHSAPEVPEHVARMAAMAGMALNNLNQQPVEEVIDLTEEVPLNEEEAVEMALNLNLTDAQLEAIVDSVYEEEKEEESYTYDDGE